MQFQSLDEYFDYYFDPERTSVWEREGFAAYISGLWALQAVLKGIPEVDTKYIYYYTAKYRYGGAIYHGTYGGYTTRIQTNLLPLARAQHFSVTARILPDDQIPLYWLFYPNRASDSSTPAYRTYGSFLTGEFRIETDGIVTGVAYRRERKQISLHLNTTDEIPTVEGGAMSRYMDRPGDPLFGDPQLVRFPTKESWGGEFYKVDRDGFDAYIRDVYNPYYLQRHPALSDVMYNYHDGSGIYVELPSGDMNVSAFAKAIIDKKTITFSVSGRIGMNFEIK